MSSSDLPTDEFLSHTFEINPHSWLDLVIIRFQILEHDTGVTQKADWMLDSDNLLKIIERLMVAYDTLVDKHGGIRNDPKLRAFFEKHGVEFKD